MRNLITAKKQHSLQECLICEQEKDQGIHLLNYFICAECESEIVQTNTDDRGYAYYLKRLKKVRDVLLPAGEDKTQ
ncbi:Inhibitor of sigma-G Gin [Evansella caseinilytica]|uniref:Inhibitor of sigma-G Gin n=1 Tax=Evansella caseinilytica TaxID=1503961 RepID=A0A1H3UXU3_9BACI|nr:sigma factor G inhibitor Gin [Evansella caseinilytica]SDZ66629.1 Inhibitor of sigma-G Gin [Evansella caseinilytica]